MIETFYRNALTNISSLVAVVIERSMLWGSNCNQNNSTEVCDDHVKYEESDVNKLVWNTVSLRRELLNDYIDPISLYFGVFKCNYITLN